MSALLMTRRFSRGFTLIEVLVVIAMLGILAAIAIPNYTAYIQRAHRADAKALLLQVSQWQQRQFTETNSFFIGALPAAMQTKVPATGTTRYTVASTATTTTFALTAVPEGPQAGDECGTFAITNLGVRTVTIKGTDYGAGSAEVVRCWGR